VCLFNATIFASATCSDLDFRLRLRSGMQDMRYNDMIDMSLFDLFNSTEGITKNGHEKRRNSIRSAFPSNFPIYMIYFVKYLDPVETNSTLVIFAIIAALGLVTVVPVDIILTIQEAEGQVLQ
jgi:hypothetical protein